MATARPPHVGPQALKALVHPLRIAMWEYLGDHGSATATQLAQVLGESTGQTSYHLRQLERFGFVEDDPEHPRGRDRWWRAVGFTVLPDDIRDDAMHEDVVVLLRSRIAARASLLARWVDHHRDEPPDWLEAATSTEARARMTAAELTALSDELEEVVTRHADAAKARRAAGGGDAALDERRVRVYVDAFALPADEADARG